MNSINKKGISLVLVLIVGLAAGVLIGTQWIASGGSDESGGAQRLRPAKKKKFSTG